MSLLTCASRANVSLPQSRTHASANFWSEIQISFKKTSRDTITKNIAYLRHFISFWFGGFEYFYCNIKLSSGMKILLSLCEENWAQKLRSFKLRAASGAHVSELCASNNQLSCVTHSFGCCVDVCGRFIEQFLWSDSSLINYISHINDFRRENSKNSRFLG